MDYYNESALRAEVARNHLTLEQTADAIGVSRKQFWVKLRNGNWRLHEAYRLAQVLNMDEQRFNEVFFYPNSHVTSA